LKSSRTLIGCLALLAGCNNGGASTAASAAATTVAKSANAVKLEFFVMSQCPYGVQVMNGVKDSVDKLGPDLDFHFDFIGSNNNGALSSMHGADEVTGDIVQLCANKYAPAAVMTMIACQNKAPKEVAHNWEGCAKEANIDTAKVKACLEGPEGKTLLTESFARSAARGAQGSPTMFMSGKPYNKGRGSADFLRAICGEFKDTKPAACAALPPQPKVNVTVISDSRCTECNTQQLVGMLGMQIGNPVMTQLDYASVEGRAAFEALPNSQSLLLPIVLFDETIKADTSAMGAFARYLKPLGDKQTLAIGAAWQPACMNENGCQLDACKNTLGCKTETPKTLDVFVMSQCPYGVQALNAMQEVLTNFKGSGLAFNVNYIASGNAKAGFQSMHGAGEVDEDLRELCVIKKYAKDQKFMDYVLCRNKEIRSGDWEKCATNGIDAKAIKACATGDEGKKLLEENLGHATALGIGASPTWLANGKFKFSGIDAETIRKNVCAHNPTLKGCDKTLSATTNGTPAGGCAQ
jgi:2-hydroxychromene-2-carboxylate isomerase